MGLEEGNEYDKIRIVLAYDRTQEVIQLFDEYMKIIIAEDPEVIKCLSAQHYEDEFLELGIKYGLPWGRLYLACTKDQVAGCVALRQLEDGVCEMKRLYVRPDYRGKGIGKRLVERILADAREIGYKHIRLDTFPFMESAILMYKEYGFYGISSYNDNPASNAVFMQLDF